MSLKIKIVSSFALLVVMLIIAGLMSIMEFRKVSLSIDTVMQNNYRSVGQAKLMLDALEREDSGLLMFLMGNRSQGSEIVFSADSEMRKALEVAWNNVTEKNESRCMEAVSETYEKFYASVEKAIGKEEDLSPEERNRTYFLDSHPLFLSAKEAVYALMKLNEESIYQQTSVMKERAKRAVMPAIVSIVTAVIFAVLFNFFIAEYFVSPIRRLCREVSLFYPERGHLKANIRSKDEIKRLETEINNLIHRLQSNNE